MLRRNDVLGLNVIELSSGRHIGRIHELLISREEGELKGLVVEGRSGFRFIEADDIHSFGQDAVTLADSNLATPLSEDHKGNWLVGVLGKPVLSEDGVDMGTIDDICFDEKSGDVVGFQVSGGIIQDLTEGKELLPLQSKLTYGEDAVIVHEIGGY